MPQLARNLLAASLDKSPLMLLGLVVSLAVGACNSVDEGKACDTPCATGDLYQCKIASLKLYDCHPSQSAANFWCTQKGGGSATLVACPQPGGGGETGAGEESGAGGAPWDPGAHVRNPSPGTYYIDFGFAEHTKNDLNVLWNDSTRLAESSSGHPELLGVARGDLAYVLGLRTGDVLLSINNHDLSDIDDVIHAYRSMETETRFVLEYERSNSVHTHVYTLIE
jgi:hypothetical protein